MHRGQLDPKTEGTAPRRNMPCGPSARSYQKPGQEAFIFFPFSLIELGKAT